MLPFQALMQRFSQLKADNAEQDVRVQKADAISTPEHPVSTFINRVRYVPKQHTAFVTIGNKTYWYPMNDYQMAAWMRSESLGRWYNDHVKLKTIIRRK